MNGELITAWTPAVSNPPFLNITRLDDGSVRVTIRGPADSEGFGQVVCIEIPLDDWTKISQDIDDEEFRRVLPEEYHELL